MLESSELPIQLVSVESGSQAQVGREKGQGVSKLRGCDSENNDLVCSAIRRVIYSSL